jgi:molecular chaperone DnaK
VNHQDLPENLHKPDDCLPVDGESSIEQAIPWTDVDGAAVSAHGPWTLAIDFGTSFTVAAVRVDGRAPEALEIGGDRRTPSVVLVDSTDGADRMIVGRVAEDLSSTRPGSVVRAPKRRLGEPAPIVLGGKPYQTVDIAGALLRHVYDEAVRHQGSPPSRVCLTHPATWSRPRLARLLEAAAKAGLADVALIAEPVAAAMAYAADTTIPDGAHVAVYDLGGGTFDTTVLRAEHGSFTVIGRPGGDANLGGELFDELLVNLIGERLDPKIWDELQVSDDLPWRQAAAALRNEVRRAKEALSSAPLAELLLPLPGGMVHEKLSRAELDAVVAPYVEESVRVLVQSVRDAGIDPAALTSVYLVGGASRMPIIETALARELPGVAISRRGDPKTAVAIGATLADPTDAVLDLQAAGGRTTLESQPPRHEPTASPLLPPPATPTVVGSSIADGTVIESLPSMAPPPPPSPAPPPHYGPPPQSFPQPPPAKPKSKAPIVVGAVAAGVLLIGGLGVAVTRGRGSSTALTTTTTAATTTTTSIATAPSTFKLPPLVPTTTVAGAAPTTAPTVPPTAAPPRADLALTEEQAGFIVLNLPEVETATGQSGWIGIPFEPGPDLCGLSSPDPAFERHEVAIRSEGGDLGIAVHSAAFTYASVDDLAASLGALRQAVTACPNPTSVENGVTYSVSFTELTEQAPPFIDSLIAFGVLFSAPGQVPTSNVFAVATKGRSAVSLQYQIVGRFPNDADTAAAETLLTQLIAKFVSEIPA